MDIYHITLFVHIMTLVVAAAVTAITKLAVARRARARTVAEVLDWHNVLTSTAKLFPVCLVVFVVSGAYMMSVTHIAPWSTGFIVAGLAGVGLLLVSGIYLALKGKALGQVLEAMAKQNPNQPAPRLVPPRLVAALPMINTGIALSVAFDMVTKPDSVGVALAIVALGILLGAAGSLRHAAPASEKAEA
ncbi:MAG TPA: hypothetical protein VGM67_06110 [Gemmatimonadaceae bacterium]|jgi:hypothetical protein